MFTNDNTNGMYSDELLAEMNEALETMLADVDDSFRADAKKNYSDRIMPIAEEGMTAEQIVAAAR